MKKILPAFFTFALFAALIQTVSPVVAVTKTIAPPVEENFSPDPTASARTAAKAVASASSAVKASATPAGTTLPLSTKEKTVVLKGPLSATPSAIGRFLIKTDDGDTTIDTDKNTKIFNISETGIKAKTTLSKFKLNDTLIVVGNNSADNKSIVAKYVVMDNQAQPKPRTGVYGVVSTREASGSSTFKLAVKSPGKDETQIFIVNNETVVKVKDVDSPTLNDIKIGDRVTLLAYTDDKSGNNIVTRIFVLPGRAAGLLRDIRDASSAADKKTTASPSAKSSLAPAKEATASQPKATLKP